MAVDSALLELAQRGAPYLRLYSWSPACLSFGRHEPALRRYDRDRILREAIDCVRRPTGGRAVWHARELTYAVAAPLGLLGGLRSAYARIHAMLADALKRLGARPTLAPATRALSPGAGPCFSGAAGGEVLLEGRKVAGSAQLREGGALLQHGSLLLEDDQALVRSLSTPPGPDGGEIPLSAALGRRISFDEAAAAVLAVAPDYLGPIGSEGDPPDLAEAVERHAGRFRDPGWTWER
jgi:lipoate-protein ligase A